MDIPRQRSSAQFVKRKDHLQGPPRRCPRLKTPTIPLVDLKETEQIEQFEANQEPFDLIEAA